MGLFLASVLLTLPLGKAYSQDEMIVRDVDDPFRGTFDISWFNVDASTPQATTIEWLITDGDGNGSLTWVDRREVVEYNDGGEARGKSRLLGNTDSFNLGFITNNIQRFNFLNTGEAGFPMAFTDALVTISDTAYAPLRVIRTTSGTTGVGYSMGIQHTTSDDMVDGFGSGITFEIEDSAAVRNIVGRIAAARDGADNEGAFYVQCGTGGVEFGWFMDSAGLSRFGQDTDIANMQPVDDSRLTIDGSVALLETTTPAAQTDTYGKLYTLSSDSLIYFQDDGGTEYSLLQNLWETITGDTGTMTADSLTDTLNIVGEGDYLVTSVSDPTVTIEVVEGFDNIIHTFNGQIQETIDGTVTEDGGTVSFNLQAAPTGDLTLFFSDHFTTFDSTPAVSIALTAGTDAVPVENFIYILESNKTLTVSTVGFPATEHAPVATVLLRTAATTGAEGALAVQLWTDHNFGTNNQGHMSHVNSWIRTQPATWRKPGVDFNIDIVGASSPDDVFFDSTSGIVLQLHAHAFPAFDMGTGSDIHVVNDSVDPYDTVTNLNVLLTDALGGSMASRYFTLVIWGVVSEAAGDSHLMVNLPVGSYLTESAGIADDLGYTVLEIPAEFTGKGFLISSHLFKHSPAGGGAWDLIQSTDLRGLFPSTGGGGGSIIPGTTFADGSFELFNTVDNTKVLVWDLSAITTANTRTWTAPDRDLDLATPIFEAVTYNIDQTVPTILQVGELRWNSDEGTLDLGVGYVGGDANVVLQVGQEQYFNCKNQTGSQIDDGKLVYAVGTIGASGRILIAEMVNNGVPSEYVMGITTEDIPNGEDGYVTSFGKIRGINTLDPTPSETWADGDILYIHPSLDGFLTKIIPTEPQIKMVIAIVIFADDEVGELLVRPTFTHPLREANDVETYDPTAVAEGSILSWNATDDFWEIQRDPIFDTLTSLGDVTIGADGAGGRTLTLYSATVGEGLDIFTTVSGFSAITALDTALVLQSEFNTDLIIDAGGVILFRDRDDSVATRMSLDTATGLLTLFGRLDVVGDVDISGAVTSGAWQGTRVDAAFLDVNATMDNVAETVTSMWAFNSGIKLNATTTAKTILGNTSITDGIYLEFAGTTHTTAAKRGDLSIVTNSSDAHNSSGEIRFLSYNGSTFDLNGWFDKSGNFWVKKNIVCGDNTIMNEDFAKMLIFGDTPGLYFTDVNQATGINSALRFGGDTLAGLHEDGAGEIAFFGNVFRLNTGDLDVSAGDLLLSSPTIPGSAGATGVSGTISWDASYIYVCIATDTWKRVAISTWP